MDGSDDGRTRQVEGVPPAKAVHSHPEGKCGAAVLHGDCMWRGVVNDIVPLLGVTAAC